MSNKTPLIEIPEPIVINQRANPRYADASSGEIRLSELRDYMRGYYRVIGGDNGDILFNGYDVEGDTTIIRGAVLRTTLTDLSHDDIMEIVHEIIDLAISSVGLEAIGSVG